MQKKDTFLMLTFLSFSLLCFGQVSLNGTIQSKETKEKLSATIEIHNLNKVQEVSNDGHFTYSNLPKGTYQIICFTDGYETLIQKITLQKDTTIVLELSPNVTEYNDVLITGVSRSTELKRSPLNVLQVKKAQLTEQSSTNLIDALKRIPGVDQIATGTAISKPIIRGLGYNRVITLNDGIRQEGQQWGDEHGIEIDEYSVDQVEIIKGPGSLLYGSDAIAGVVNFLAPKPMNADGIKTQLLSNYQSNHNFIGYSIFNQGRQKDIFWNVRFSSKMAGNYRNKYDGIVYNSGFNEYNGSFQLGVQKKWGNSSLSFSTYNSTINMVEGERDSLGNFLVVNQNGEENSATKSDLNGYKIGFPHQQIHHIRVANATQLKMKNGVFHSDIAFQKNIRKEFGDVTAPEAIDLLFDLSTVNYAFRYNLKEIKKWETSFGISGMYQQNENKGIEFIIPAYGFFDIGGFIYTQKTIAKNWNIAGGIRFDSRVLTSDALRLDTNEMPTMDENAALKFDRINQAFNGLSGSLGVSYQVKPSTTIKLNLSRGYRAPTLAELASNGKHEGTFRYEYGSKNLKPEFSQQIDLSLLVNREHLTLEVSPFVNQLSNAIYTEKLVSVLGGDSIPDPNDPTPAYQFKQQNALLFGGEIYIDIHPHPLDWLHIANSFAYVNAQFNSKMNGNVAYMPFTPAPKYRGEIKATRKKWGKTFTNTSFQFSLDHYFAQNRFAENYETATSAYSLLNVGVHTTINLFKKADFLYVAIQVDNLLDAAFQNHLSRLKYAPENLATGRIGVFNMGRTISLKMVVNF
jgi:iron complex outermembrane receptor protein